jgi:tetratricopeptide (TPR) repeat protein
MSTPSIAEALASGFEFHKRGELAQAESTYREVLAREPRHARALHLLGVLALQTARLEEAIALLEQSVAADSSAAEYLGNLALAYSTARRHTDALNVAERGCALNPRLPDIHHQRGLALFHLGRLEEAVESFRRALELFPDYASAHSNLGVTLQALGLLDEAEGAMRRAIELEPSNAVYHFNLGTLAKDRADPTTAIGHYDEALRRDPSYSQALAARGAALLSLGLLRPGWQYYEHRADCPQFNTFKFPQPMWDGSPLGGRTLLVHCEQGFGDTLQFIRYLKSAEPTGGTVVIAVQPALIPLLAQAGFHALVSRDGPLPPFDVHAPLLSLPRILGTDEATIPRNVPYLAAPPARIAHWRGELARCEGLKVGIACKGRSEFQGDRFRSIPLQCFAPLARIPGVCLVSLQRKPSLAELAGGKVPFEVVEFGEVLDDPPFVDLAAVIQNLDLVVSADTAVAHLAGALGARVWAALAFAADWRWMLHRPDSPWYPTMRLFRQRRRGDWSQVFDDIAREIGGLVARGGA